MIFGVILSPIFSGFQPGILWLELGPKPTDSPRVSMAHFPRAPHVSMAHFPRAPRVSMAHFPRAPRVSMAYFPRAPHVSMAYFPPGPSCVYGTLPPGEAKVARSKNTLRVFFVRTKKRVQTRKLR